MMDDNTTTNNEETSNAPQTIGEFLKSERLKRDLSLKVISQQTKIHISILEALEENQLKKLPSQTYVRGFVKSTVKILNADLDLALSLLDSTYEAQFIKPKKSEVKLPNSEMQNQMARNTLSTIAHTPLDAVKSVSLSTGLFVVKVIAGLAIVITLGVNVKNYIVNMKEDAPVKLPKVLSTTSERNKSVVKKAPEKKVEVTPQKTDEPIEVNIIQDTKTQKTEVVVDDMSLKTISLGEKQFIDDNSIPADKLDELFPAKYRIAPTKGVETLFLNASLGDSWLTYKVDDNEIKKFVLRQGRTLFLRGKVIRIFIGNTRSLKAFYNNKPINLTTNKTGVKNMVLPEELKTKYLAPLFVFKDDGTVVTSDEFVQEKKPSTNPI